MTFLTRPFLGFVFAVQPVWLPLLILDVVTIAVLIFRERLEPRALIFWISVTVVVPFVGPLLYLLFGCNLVSDRIFSRKEEAERGILASDKLMTGDARILRMGGADICTGGNVVGLRWSADDYAADMVSDIRSAGERIGLMSRWLDYPEPVIEALAEKAREGVDVRVMTSAAGFGRTRGAGMLRKAGAEVRTFRSKLIAVVGMRPANRNLRSMLAIDGKVAYIGKGAVMRVEGPAAHRAMLRYSADWAFATHSEPSCGLEAPVGTGDAEVQLVSGGPDAGHDAPMRACFEHVISSAKHSLMVIAPYLTPNDEAYSALKMAVFSGVDVTVLLPRKGRHWYQSWNSLSASNPLMMAGVKVGPLRHGGRRQDLRIVFGIVHHPLPPRRHEHLRRDVLPEGIAGDGVVHPGGAQGRRGVPPRGVQAQDAPGHGPHSRGQDADVPELIFEPNVYK